MRALLFLSLLAVVGVVCATPIDPKRWLINRPADEHFLRERRAPQDVKGGEAPVKGIGRVQLTRTQPTLRKGEYACAGRACRLRPGDAPCQGCQGPVPLVKK